MADLVLLKLPRRDRDSEGEERFLPCKRPAQMLSRRVPAQHRRKIYPAAALVTESSLPHPCPPAAGSTSPPIVLVDRSIYHSPALPVAMTCVATWRQATPSVADGAAIRTGEHPEVPEVSPTRQLFEAGQLIKHGLEEASAIESTVIAFSPSHPPSGTP